jgi:thiamine-phosphate pyrophosphorylase
MLQVREKLLGPTEVRKLVLRFRELLPSGALLLVNGTGRHGSFAAEVGADGVHLGGGDPQKVGEARRALPPFSIIGYSAHSAGEIAPAAEEGADYVTLSPIFDPLSKERALPPLGLEALARACRSAKVPVYALGGIDSARARATREAGAYGVAVIGAILGAADPGAAARGLIEAVEGQRIDARPQPR